MFKRFVGAALLLSALSSAAYAAPQPTHQDIRVSSFYTAWDNYYFYAGFIVDDPNVIGTNSTPISQPQQDDDVEVFLETDDARAKLRTTNTFQMAVSAAGGAYFSEGNGTRIPVGKTLWTYKFAANVDGTLNNSSDRDAGFTVELAIPWNVLGLTKTPSPGTVFGFNAISRSRPSLGTPANSFYSLSPNVKTGADVQDPSKWIKITFDSNGQHEPLNIKEGIICPYLEGRVPEIDGNITSGEWPERSLLSFGAEPIFADAPTKDEEPNTTVNALDTPPPADLKLPYAIALPNSPSIDQSTVTPTGIISLPGGNTIKIVPGGIKDPTGMQTPVPKPTIPVNQDGQFVNPLNPKYNRKKYHPTDASTDLSGSLALTDFAASKLIMAKYRLDYGLSNGPDPGKNLDQPVTGTGPWYSALRPEWHRHQLEDLRNAGIDTILLHVNPDQPELYRAINSLIEALKELKSAQSDYPLIAVDGTNLSAAQINNIYHQIPDEFRATQAPTISTAQAVLVYGNANGQTALDDGTPITVLSGQGGVATVAPGGQIGATVTPRDDGKYYQSAWTSALQANPSDILIDSWNDYVSGTEIAPSQQYADSAYKATIAQSVVFNGSKQWHAKYLANTIPIEIYPRTLYQVPIRIENAGTTAWHASEGYSLCARWYRDGRLYDDSASRVPIGTDLLPGQTATLSIGLVAINSFGDDLEPGNYTLVIDMVKGQDSWFSYSGDSPLQINVTVHDASDPPPASFQATFIGTSTPGIAGSGGDYSTTISLRNDSPASWKPTDYNLAYKILSYDSTTGQPTEISGNDAHPLLVKALESGFITNTDTSVLLKSSDGKPIEPGSYIIHWYIKALGSAAPVSAVYDEPIQIVRIDHAASFLLADVPHVMSPGKSYPAHLALQNLGSAALPAKTLTVVARWYTTTGTEIGSKTEVVLPRPLAVGASDGALVANIHAPTTPGSYILGFNIRTQLDPDGSSIGNSRGNDFEVVPVEVAAK